MPIYKYKCERCDWETEELLPMPGDDSCPCFRCGFDAKRVPAPANFTFGWTLSERSHQVGGPRDEIVPNV